MHLAGSPWLENLMDRCDLWGAVWLIDYHQTQQLLFLSLSFPLFDLFSPSDCWRHGWQGRLFPIFQYYGFIASTFSTVYYCISSTSLSFSVDAPQEPHTQNNLITIEPAINAKNFLLAIKSSHQMTETRIILFWLYSISAAHIVRKYPLLGSTLVPRSFH